MIKKITISAIFILLTVFVLSCSSTKSDYKTCDIFAMDTFISVVYKDNQNLDVNGICEKELERIESIFSKTIADSEISGINNSSTYTVSDECAHILSKSLELANATDSAFNPALGQIVSLWDITGKKHIPTEKEISSLLPYCSYTGINVTDNTVTKEYIKTHLDLGACVKGYAAQRAVEMLKENGISDAMVSIGGNIAVTGEADGRNGLWRIGIRNPFNPEEAAGYLDCTNIVISVSGDYERYFEKDGTIYHHIFDSKTGKPSDTDIKSVAVIAEDGLVSDALSTALFCMGSEKAFDFYKTVLYDFEAVIFLDNGEVAVTDGLTGLFVLFEDSGLSFAK